MKKFKQYSIQILADFDGWNIAQRRQRPEDQHRGKQSKK